jgi:hypothetical protein
MMLVMYYCIAVAILLVILVYDRYAIRRLLFALRFAISPTVFAPLNRAHVLLQVRALQRCVDCKCLMIAKMLHPEDHVRGDCCLPQLSSN